MTDSQTIYNKSHPFLASITERYSLCKDGAEKSTAHVVLNLKGSGISYQVGDSIAVHPINDPELVQNTLDALNATGEETVQEKHTALPWTFREYLARKANLNEVSKKLIGEISQRQSDPQKKERLETLLQEGNREQLKAYQAAHEVWDALQENQESQFSPQEIVLILQPLLPRFYSIASSQLVVGDEVHLTVAELVYETNGHLRRGVCTHYLCRLAPLNETCVPIYIQPGNGFTLPEDLDAPIIMVGPGTGVAPFRAFVQERVAKNAKGLNWLFFGERHSGSTFFYEEFWQEMVKAGHLRLDTAFSRDQEHKIYVQHRLMEKGSEIFALLEQGAYFYVCGDAMRMAKDVDMALHRIISDYGHLDETVAKEYVKRLKKEKRYLRDVY